MKLSKNFTLKEFTRSQTATRLGIDNTPNEEHLENAKRLFEECVQKVRDQFGVTTITSGYRGPELNERIGGSANSQHCKGQAVDFECFGHDNKEVAQWIVDNIEFDQVILEFYEDGVPDSGWIHLSYVSPEKNRRRPLTARRVDGKVVYSVGLG